MALVIKIRAQCKREYKFDFALYEAVAKSPVTPNICSRLTDPGFHTVPHLPNTLDVER